MELNSKIIDRIALTFLFFATAVVWASKPFYRPDYIPVICLIQLAIYLFFLLVKRKIFDRPEIRPYTVKVKWFVHRHTNIPKLISASCLINVACLLLGVIFIVIIKYLNNPDDVITPAGISFLVCLIITAISNSLIYILDYWLYRGSKTLFILGCLAICICPLIVLDIMPLGYWELFIKGLQDVVEYAYIFVFCFTFLRFIFQLKLTKRLINYFVVDHKECLQHFTDKVIKAIYD